MMLLSLITGYFIELLTLFGIVLIHEFGHVAAAKSFGWQIREVTLLPFGGVAEMEDSSSVPAHEEIIVALAGPLQNALMISLAFLMKLWGVQTDTGWWDYFMTANLMIGLFNLLPIFPLDGGKLLQSILSYVFQYHQTLITVIIVSLTFSGAMIVYACLPLSGTGIQLNLFMLGLFLLYSNWYEYRNLTYRHMRFLISRQRRIWGWISQGVLAQPIVVDERRTVTDILRMLKREKYHLIYVLNQQGKICGVFTEQRIINAFFHEKKMNSAISELLV